MLKSKIQPKSKKWNTEQIKLLIRIYNEHWAHVTRTDNFLFIKFMLCSVHCALYNFLTYYNEWMKCQMKYNLKVIESQYLQKQ